MSFYKAGQEVPFTGIYQVVHEKEHKQRHEVTAVYGEPFPPCRDCGNKVGFKLVDSAIHIRAEKTFVA